MSDVELQGTIVFNADTAKAEKQVEDAMGGVAPKEKPPKANPKSESVKGFVDVLKSLRDALKNTFSGNIFGSIGSAGTFGKLLAGIGGGIHGNGAGTAAANAARSAVKSAQGTAGASPGGNGIRIPPIIPGAVPAAAGAAGGSIPGAVPAAAVTLGPIAIGAALAAAFVAFGAALAAATKSVIAFGRTLAEVSPRMAMTFANFDVQIMMLKRTIGEAIAPAMNRLLNEVLNLAKLVLPEFTAALALLIEGIIIAFNVIKGVAVVGTVAGVLAAPGLFVPLLAIGYILKKAAEKYLEAPVDKDLQFFTPLNEFLNNQNSKQQAETDAVHARAAARGIAAPAIVIPRVRIPPKLGVNGAW